MRSKKMGRGRGGGGRTSKRYKGDEDNNDENCHDNSSGEQLPSQINDDHRIVDLERQVFENDVLREKILTYVIQNDGGSKHDTRSLRLVQKTWMKDVSTIMKKLGKPLYELRLPTYNFSNVSGYVQVAGVEPLDNFISTVALSQSTIENVIPAPFSLSIDGSFFQDENRQSFSDFLTGGSAAGMLELAIDIPANGGSMDFVFCDQIPSFPILQKLSVRFLMRDNYDSAVVESGSNSYLLPFLQSILHGAKDLKRIIFLFGDRFAVIPDGIRYLTLPRSLNVEMTLRSSDMERLTTLHPTLLKSLTYLELTEVLSTKLECLVTKFIPNLKYLKLPITSGTLFPDNLIFRILDQYKEKLRNLDFLHGGAICTGNSPKGATYFNFPVMECLETFSNNSTFAELEPELTHPLQTSLPKLNKLTLTNHSVNMFRKWTANSCFATVTKLTVSLVDENVFFYNDSHEVTIHLEEMQALHMAFPNVRVLELGVTDKETCGLKYLFKEMKLLTQLTLYIKRGSNLENSDHWDSLLTGIPIDTVKALRAIRHFWERVNSIDIAADESSLKNLNALRSLSLIAPLYRNANAELITDAVFHLAFLKMPNLRALSLKGAFKASDKMTQVWKDEQRSITYEGFN